ncbi:hypothetical protein [Bauldia litoralis]|uniref:hypothetical protein n=1 Tax=Bauldia litoralis TaxID=665467 RepID=UPI001114259B|nr:hypothetical protein [Bauldia litoralis]
MVFSSSPAECITLGMANNTVIRSDPNDEARERIAEIGEILTLGLIRLQVRKSRSLFSDDGEGLVDCLGTPSGHAGTEPETTA